MLFRRYGHDSAAMRRLLPSLLRVTWHTWWRAGWPTRLALLRVALTGVLTWLPRRWRERRLGLAMPVTLQVIDDVRCGAACANCLFTSFRRRQRRLGLRDLDRLLDQALEMGITQVYLLGADPFWRDDIDGFLSVLERHRSQLFLLFTEGQRVTADHVRRLARAGHVLPVLNLDGLRDATDRRKGAGAWDRVERLMARLNAHGLPFGVSTMVSTANVDDVTSDAFIDALQRRGAFFVATVPYTPVDLRAEASLVLDDDALEGLYHRSMAHNRRGRTLVVFDLLGIERHLTECPSARQTVTVFHDGTLTPCLAIPFGHRDSNVTRRPLLDLFIHDPLYRAIRARHAAVHRAGHRPPCMFYGDRRFLRRYLEDHAEDINVLAPHAADWLRRHIPKVDSDGEAP